MFSERTFGFLWVLISLIASSAVTAKSKYYDGETRPYEFGYRIEGNQHRFEKKDANGLISGEFGFITGDGVYHQSVYATDENGNFKLISLKSSFKFEKSTTTTAPPTTPAPVTHAPQTLKLLKSCSNCRVFEKVVSDKTSQTVSDSVAVTKKGEQISIGNSNRPNNIEDRSNGNPVPKTLSITNSNDNLPKMRTKSNTGTIGTVARMNIAIGISSAAIQASEQIKLKQKENSQFKATSNAANHHRPSGKEASPQIKENGQERDEQYDAKTLNELPSPHQASRPIKSVQVTVPVSLQTKAHQTSKPIQSVQVTGPVSLQTKDHKTSEPIQSSRATVPVSLKTKDHQTSEPIQSSRATVPVSLKTKDHQTSEPIQSSRATVPVSLKTKDHQTSEPIQSVQVTGPVSLETKDHQTSKPVHSVQVTVPVSLQTKDHQTSKPVHSSEVTVPVSLQTKSQIIVPISTDHITHSKSVASSKAHLSSKTAINDFIGDVLYRFNYTAGYHGHNEEGDSAGNKRGGYFIVGRDNIRRGVIYVANANGFAPVVKYEKVSPAEAPHEDTEKSAGLRGYEFEWFHKGKSKVDSQNESGR